MILSLIFLAASANPSPSHTPKAPPALTLADLSWMEGTWRGVTRSGATTEEQWGEAIGSSRLGSFRMVGADGVVTFYEILALVQTATGVEMRLRHFDAALVAQEEKEAPMVFVATKVTDRSAVFESAAGEKIRYERTGDALVITVDRKSDRGPKQIRFDFKRR